MAVVSVLAILGLAIASPLAHGEPIFQANGAVYSHYFNRGLRLYDGWSAQPSIAAGYREKGIGSFVGELWWQLPLEDSEQGISEFVQTDFRLAYVVKTGPLEMSLGNQWTGFSNGRPRQYGPTREVFASLGVDLMLSPTFRLSQDYGGLYNQYLEINLSHTIDSGLFQELFVVSPSIDMGFAGNASRLYEGNGLVQVTYGVELPVRLSLVEPDDIVIAPGFFYTDGVDAAAANETWGGIRLRYALK